MGNLKKFQNIRERKFRIKYLIRDYQETLDVYCQFRNVNKQI